MPLKLIPFIKGLAYVPKKHILNPAALEQRLTVTVTRPNEFAQGEEDKYVTTQAMCYDSQTFANFIGVPRAFAWKEYRHLKFLNTYARGAPARPELFPKTISPRNDMQRIFFEDLIRLNDAVGPQDIFVLANTGVGKTAAALNLIAHDGVPTLVIVHTNRLKEQWFGSVDQHNGMRFFWSDDWVRRYAGIAQQDRCDYQGRLVVVGVIHSLARRDYGSEFYSYFGRVIFDEIHLHATAGLHEALKKFSARVRIGMTATRRRDDFQQIISLHLGRARVTSKLATTTPTVYIHKFYAQQVLPTHNDGVLINSLSRIRDRNLRLINLIVRKYEQGHNIVVLSDRIEQLSLLALGTKVRTRCSDHEVGLFVGKYKTGRYKIVIYYGRVFDKHRHVSKETFATRHDADRYHRDWIKQNPDKDYLYHKVSEAYYTPTETEYDEMKRTSRILFATYQIFSVGMDVPRMTCGIEATPRGDVRQAIGRIGRDAKNKFPPEWHSVVDVITPPPELPNPFAASLKPYGRFTEWAAARLSSYQHHKANIKEVRDAS